MNVFHENLKRMASDKDMTLREIAEKIGVSDVRMSKIADKETPLRPLEILNLLLLFDCKPTDLLGDMMEGYFDD